MKLTGFALSALFYAGNIFAQTPAALPAQTILPVIFTQSVSAAHAKTGDQVQARVDQVVTLPGGQRIPAGSTVLGHVVDASAFSFDKTPYAKQKPSALAIEFDTLVVRGERTPVHVTLRAMADPVTSNDARDPAPSDIDSKGTVTQVGGDQLTPSENEITSSEGDIVGYNKRGGPVAHLIAAAGRDGSRCDGSDTEQPVSIFSASACGLYGFAGVALSRESEATFVLRSARFSPKIWKNTAALLEVQQ